MPHIFFSETIYSECMKFTHSIIGYFLYTCYFSTNLHLRLRPYASAKQGHATRSWRWSLCGKITCVRETYSYTVREFHTFWINSFGEKICGALLSEQPSYIHTYTHTYTYTYIHTYIHIYIHTYMSKNSFRSQKNTLVRAGYHSNKSSAVPGRYPRTITTLPPWHSIGSGDRSVTP
jgi:hypothetical protein